MTGPRTLVVTAHADPGSLTHHVATRLVDLLDPSATTTAHLAQEGFDPRFGLGDHRTYAGAAPVDPVVRAEQDRLDAVEHVVLVFPVHWWSLPALLKGWVDRVFIGGWAFDHDATGTITPRLQRLTVHLVPLSGTSAASFGRHGYAQAFTTQVEEGILDFCGAARGVTAFLHDTESGDATAVADAVSAVTAGVAEAIRSDPRHR